MSCRLSANNIPSTQRIQIRGSKSESNRLLILQKLFGDFLITNLSDSVDTMVLKQALSSDSDHIDIGHTGTAMRFLTAYYAIQKEKTRILKGSSRMHQRPIAPLVQALQNLGAEIQYLEKIGYPPLKIIGKECTANSVEIDASMSSQYITALLLIAPALENGLELKLIGEITSVPYIKMSLELLKKIGASYEFENNRIRVFPLKENKLKTIEVESDWSSASYLYSFFALSEMKELRLARFQSDSLQGDSKLQEIFLHFGVKSHWKQSDLVLRKTDSVSEHLDLDCSDFPDLAQTIVITAFALGVSLHLTGLHTLKIKETDRLVALQNEIQKFEDVVNITNNSLSLVKRKMTLKEGIHINTYQDHRMAMAFAPLAIKIPIYIENPQVVEKSFPEFWEVWKQLGIDIE